MLSIREKNAYINEVIIANFQSLVNQDIYSLIYDTDGLILVATQKSASALGLNSPEEMRGLSYRDSSSRDVVRDFFKTEDPLIIERIQENCKTILKLQQYTIKHKCAVSYIDLIPYANQFEAFLVSLIPLFHPSGIVVAIQSYAIQTSIFGFLSYVQNLKTESIRDSEGVDNQKSILLTKREEEILFLIAHGITQDQIAHILNINRGTVSRAISSQLCPKFGISGSNTKLLCKAAIENDFHSRIPQSLWQPVVIITDQAVLGEIADYEI